MRRSVWILCLIATLTLTATVAKADLVFTFSNPFPGKPAPSGTAPWLTATFSENGTLTLTSGLSDPTAFLSEIYFNTTSSPTGVPLSYFSGVQPSGITAGEDAYPADGDGKYDINILYPTAASDIRFTVGSATVLALGSGITVDYFNAVSTHQGGEGEYYAAAHVQDGGGTWIYASAPQYVPEPGAVLLLTIMGGVVLLLGKRFTAR